MEKSTKYNIIYNYFKEKILNGELKNGDVLPSESEIIEMFNVSHMTINRSMTKLASAGYIKRLPGNGSFVCNDYKKAISYSDMSRVSINQLISSIGLEEKTVLLSYKKDKAINFPDYFSRIDTNENENIYEIIRLKYGNERLICYTRTYIPQRIIPTIDISKLEGSLDSYYKELGIPKDKGYTKFQACIPSGDLLNYFSINTPLMHQTIYWSYKEKPAELADNYFDGEMLILTNPREISMKK